MAKIEEAKLSSRADALKEWTIRYYDTVLNKGVCHSLTRLQEMYSPPVTTTYGISKVPKELRLR